MKSNTKANILAVVTSSLMENLILLILLLLFSLGQLEELVMNQ